MTRKRHGLTILLSIVAIFLLSTLTVWASGTQESKTASSGKMDLSFGIATPGGTFYQLGAGFANIFNKYVPEVMVTGESTGGSVANVNLLATGKLDLGFAGSAYVIAAEKRGLSMSNVRLIGAGYSSAVQWIVRKNSPIKSIKDFAGKRIDLGGVGSGTLDTAKFALETGYGLSTSDYTPMYIGKSGMANALRDKSVDAAIFFAYPPTSGVLDVSSTTAVRMVPFSKEALARIYKADPAYPPVTIKKGTYSWLDQNISTMATPCLFLVSAKVPEDIVYKLVKALYEHPQQKNAIMPAAKGFNLDDVFVGTQNIGLKFAPGAIRYFKEKGIWKNH